MIYTAILTLCALCVGSAFAVYLRRLAARATALDKARAASSLCWCPQCNRRRAAIQRTPASTTSTRRPLTGWACSSQQQAAASREEGDK